MRHRVLAALLPPGSPLLTLLPRGTADGRGASYIQAAASARVWEGHHELVAANGEAAVCFK